MKSYLVAVVAVWMVTWCCVAARPVPNPMKSECGVSRESWVCDPSAILNQHDMSAVEMAVADVRDNLEAAECGKGYQMGVAIIHSVMAYGESRTDAGIRRLAKKTHDDWGVGFSDCQTGIVVVMAIDDRKLYVSTGRATRRVLTDSMVDTLSGRLKPLLREEKYGEALVKLCHDIKVTLASGVMPEEPWSFDWGHFFVFLMFLVWLGTLIYNCFERYKYNTVASRLERVSRLRSALEARSHQAEMGHGTTAEQDTATTTNANSVTQGDQAEAPPPNSDPTSDAAAGSSGGGDGSSGGQSRDGGGQAATSDSDSVPAFVSDHCPICFEDFPRARSGAGGGVGGAAGAGAGAGREGVATLLCGHQFCTACAVEWLKSHSTCPVCRQGQSDLPGVGKTGGVAGGMAAEAPTASTRTGARVDPSLIEFELLRLHALHPNYVTMRQVNDWSSPTYSRWSSFHTDPSFVESRPNIFGSSGSGSGSSSSWGGGGSFGGGGGGTSW